MCVNAHTDTEDAQALSIQQSFSQDIIILSGTVTKHVYYQRLRYGIPVVRTRALYLCQHGTAAGHGCMASWALHAAGAKLLPANNQNV